MAALKLPSGPEAVGPDPGFEGGVLRGLGAKHTCLPTSKRCSQGEHTLLDYDRRMEQLSIEHEQKIDLVLEELKQQVDVVTRAL